MERKHVKVWYHAEGDYLEIIRAQGRLFPRNRQRSGDGKGRCDGNVVGFSVLKVSALKEHPIDGALGS
jgi:hypothetical protein